ncbi:uncharacterized protein [Argopecten irradians]|uniref:uncharacterized protein n=1 Tax=Argopecten irradians TaxID=31199 RepID=UPI0037142F80
MEKHKSEVVTLDPASDNRSPSEISLLLDDRLDDEPFHHKPFRKPPLEGEERKAKEMGLHLLQSIHPTDFVLLMYGFMNDNKIDLDTITDKDLDRSENTVSWYDFKSMTIYSGVHKSSYTRDEVIKAAERLTDYYPEEETGPFTEKNADRTYSLLDPEHMEYMMLYYYGRHNMCMLVRVVPWQAMFLNVIPWDLDPVHQPAGFHRTMNDDMSMQKNDCMLASKRMLQDIHLGFVNDMATSPFFFSNGMKSEFFKHVKEEGDLNKLFLAVDKFSKSGQPKTFLYCIVATAKPNTDFLGQVLALFMESDLSLEEKTLQLTASCAAACRWGHTLIYEKLCGKVKKPTFEMLRKTVIGGNVDIMRGILRDYNWSEHETCSAMEWACFLGLDDVVNELHNFGVCFSERCLYYAASLGNMGLFLRICSEGHDLESTFKDGQTLLHVAAERGHFSIVEFLVHRGGVNVNAENSKGETALHLALENGHEEVVETLLDGDVDTNHQDAVGSTLLHKACAMGNLQLVDKILTVGCNTDVRDHSGRTILHKAAFGGNLDIIQRLRQHDHQMDVFDNNGNSVMHYASIQGHRHVVDYVINEFPELIGKENDEGWNPIACASFGGHFTVVDFLTQHRVGTHVITKSGKHAKQLAEEGLSCKQSNMKYFMEQFGEFVTFGSISSFNQVVKLLNDIDQRAKSKEGNC